MATTPTRAGLAEGATLIDPESVWFAFDTKRGRDVTVEPHVVFGPGVEIADGASIHAFSHIEVAVIGAQRNHWPFCADQARHPACRKDQVANFVEAEEGAKLLLEPRSIISPMWAMRM